MDNKYRYGLKHLEEELIESKQQLVSVPAAKQKIVRRISTMATNRVPKGELVLVLDEPSTSMQVLHAVADRLGVEDSNVRVILVSRIKSEVSGLADTDLTLVKYSDLEAAPRRDTTREEPTRTREEPTRTREDPRSREPELDDSDAADLLGKRASQARNFLKNHGMTGFWQKLGVIVLGLLWQWLDDMLEARKFIDEKEMKNIRAAVTAEMNGKLIKMAKVLQTPDLADEQAYIDELGKELALAIKEAGKRLASTSGTGTSFWDKAADLLEGKKGG